MAVVTNRVENPGFFRPIERSGGDSKKLLKFCDRFFSIGLTQWTANYQETHGKKRIYTITNRQSRIQHPYLSTLAKIALIAAGLRYFKGLTSAILLGAFILKCRLRMHEEFRHPESLLPISPEELSVAAPILEHGSNEEKWRNKWISTALFPLFAMGLRMDSLEEYARSVSEDAPDQLIITIGENGGAFPQAFIDQSLFLMAMLNSPMIEGLAAKKEPGTLKLQGRDLPFDLKMLKGISDKWLNPMGCEWEPAELQALSFLGLDPALKQTSPNMVSLKNLLDAGWEHHIPQEWKETPPMVKVSSDLYTFFPDIGYEITPAELPDLKMQFLSYSQEIINRRDLPEFKKYYFINKFVSDFIMEVNAKHTDQIIPSLLDVLKNFPELNNFITILDFPDRTNYTQLGELLQNLPNLFWLTSGDPWDQAPLDISTLPRCPSIKIVRLENALNYNHLTEKLPHFVLASVI